MCRFCFTNIMGNLFSSIDDERRQVELHIICNERAFTRDINKMASTQSALYKKIASEKDTTLAKLHAQHYIGNKKQILHMSKVLIQLQSIRAEVSQSRSQVALMSSIKSYDSLLAKVDRSYKKFASVTDDLDRHFASERERDELIVENVNTINTHLDTQSSFENEASDEVDDLLTEIRLGGLRVPADELNYTCSARQESMLERR